MPKSPLSEPDAPVSAARRRNMAAIRSANTGPELFVRRALHRLGFRFRLHDRRIPGSPDIVLKKYGALIDVRGCFFHGHDCPAFRLPATRRDFWEEKITANRRRDAENSRKQLALGWRVAVIWECAIRRIERDPLAAEIDRLCGWLRSDVTLLEISGS